MFFSFGFVVSRVEEGKSLHVYLYIFFLFFSFYLFIFPLNQDWVIFMTKCKVTLFTSFAWYRWQKNRSFLTLLKNTIQKGSLLTCLMQFTDDNAFMHPILCENNKMCNVHVSRVLLRNWTQRRETMRKKNVSVFSVFPIFWWCNRKWFKFHFDKRINPVIQALSRRYNTPVSNGIVFSFKHLSFYGSRAFICQPSLLHVCYLIRLSRSYNYVTSWFMIEHHLAIVW